MAMAPVKLIRLFPSGVIGDFEYVGVLSSALIYILETGADLFSYSDCRSGVVFVFVYYLLLYTVA